MSLQPELKIQPSSFNVFIPTRNQTLCLSWTPTEYPDQYTNWPQHDNTSSAFQSVCTMYAYNTKRVHSLGMRCPFQCEIKATAGVTRSPPHPLKICIHCAFSSAQLSQRHGEFTGNLCCGETLQSLRRRAAIKKWHFLCSQLFDLDMWTSYFQRERKPALPTETGRAVTWLKSAWFLTPIAKTSCSHLPCSIMNPRGLKNILARHVSLLTFRLFHRKRLSLPNYVPTKVHR